MTSYRPIKKGKRVLVIPDRHSPFIMDGAFEFVKEVAKEYKTDEVIDVGDEVEHHALSDWDHDPDGYSAGEELKKAIADLQPWYKEYPKIKVCTSNHTSRIYRQAKKHGIPVAYLKSYQAWLEAPDGYQWADRWEIDGVQYIHGDNYSGPFGALKAAKDNRQSTVMGHIHSFAGINWSATEKDLIFGMNAGSLFDRHQYAADYGKKYPNKPVISCGVVLYGLEPHLITMDLGSRVVTVDNPKVRIINNKTVVTNNSIIARLNRDEIKHRLDDLGIKYLTKTNTDKLRKLLCDKFKR